MSDPKHRAMLAKGVNAWNNWRKRNPSIKPDLGYIIWKGAMAGSIDLSRVNLSGANLEGIDLRNADLRSANLYRANLRMASLKSADLSGANLDEVDLGSADLCFARLDHASMRFACLVDTNLTGSDLSTIDYYYTAQQTTLPVGANEVEPGHLLIWLRCQDPECSEVVACLELIGKDVSYGRDLSLWQWQGQEEETAAFLVVHFEPFARPYEASWNYSMRQGLPFWKIADQEVEYVLARSRWWLRNTGIPLSQADYLAVEQALCQGSFTMLHRYLAERNRWRSPLWFDDPSASHWEDSVGFFCEECEKVYCHKHFDVERWDYGHGGEVGYIFSCRCGEGGPGDIIF